MAKPNQTPKEFYSETEAAESLGITRTRLRTLLQIHVFNDGSGCPEEITLLATDLLLLRFWHLSTPAPKVVSMPKR
jgi:hypothetical protein